MTFSPNSMMSNSGVKKTHRRNKSFRKRNSKKQSLTVTKTGMDRYNNITQDPTHIMIQDEDGNITNPFMRTLPNFTQDQQSSEELKDVRSLEIIVADAFGRKGGKVNKI